MSFHSVIFPSESVVIALVRYWKTKDGNGVKINHTLLGCAYSSTFVDICNLFVPADYPELSARSVSFLTSNVFRDS